jgi:hypothetical protein
MAHPSLLDHLAQAERRVAQAEQSLARQQKVVAELERDHPQSPTLEVARGLFQAMEGTLDSLIDQRNRLKHEADQQQRGA